MYIEFTSIRTRFCGGLSCRYCTWWLHEKRTVICCCKHVIRTAVPIITLHPWNHVAVEKVDPYTESTIENGACTFGFQRKLEFLGA